MCRSVPEGGEKTMHGALQRSCDTAIKYINKQNGMQYSFFKMVAIYSHFLSHFYCIFFQMNSQRKKNLKNNKPTNVYSGSWFLTIPDPTTAPKKEGENYFFCSTIFCIHKYHTIVLNRLRNFFLAKTLRLFVLFTQKFVFKIWVCNPGSKRHQHCN